MQTSGSFSQSRVKAPANAKNTAVLSLYEIRKMKENCQIGGLSEDQEQKLRDKQDNNEKSVARVKNWPNTIQALRRKKDDARFEKFKKEEEERRKIDQEEAEYQAEQKRQILEKANKQIFETNDRVKTFQSKLLLSDALQEREGQMEINIRKKEIEKIIEHKHAEVERENLLIAEEKDRRKKIVEDEIKRDQQAKLREQHEDFKLKYIKRLQEEKIEGEIIKQKALEAIEDAKLEEVKKKERQLEMREEIKRGNAQLKELKLVEKEKELKKEKEIEVYAKKKEAIMEMRKMREQLAFKEKQDSRQRIIDKQVKRLAELKSKEEEILNKQIKEAEIKAEEHERIKREKIEQLAKTIEKHSALQMEKKAATTAKEKVEDRQFQDFWKTKNEELHQRDVDDKTKARERCKELSDYHKKQANQKQRKAEKEFIKELEDAEKVKIALDQDEEVFSSYAERCLKEWSDNGKSVKPLLMELSKFKRKTLAA
jgi:hypothetical protein